MSLKSRRLRVTSSSPCSIAVAAISASGVRSADPRRSLPTRFGDRSVDRDLTEWREEFLDASFVRPASE